MPCASTLSALGATLFLASTGGEKALVIGTEDSFPPYVIRDDSGGLTGFDVAVMTEICTRTGHECTWETTSFEELIPGVAEGRFDVVLGGMAITPQRRQLVDFSMAYTWGGAEEWFVGRPGAPAPEVARIAVEAGTIHEHFLRAEGLEYRGYANEHLALQALAAGEADLALGPYVGRTDLEPLIGQQGFDYLYSVEIPDEGTGMAVCKGNRALLDQIDATLESMMADGTLDQLDNRWFQN